MKKYFIGIIALIACAFTFKPSSEPTPKKQVSLYWFIPGTTPTYTGRQNTHTAEVAPSLCPDSGSNHCEDGYDDDDLVTSGNPYGGLKSGATINDFIRKS